MRTHLDLFSGIGGFALAAQWNGYTTVGFCEIEPYAQKVLIERFGAVLADALPAEQWRQPWKGQARLYADIFALNGADYAGVDLLTGGFPCQPFSCAGKRRGKEDDRHLWPEMRRIIDEARPAWVLAENVPGIIGMELDNVLSDLENIGYACWPIVVPACAVDARHRRDRVWIVCHSNTIGHSRSMHEAPGETRRRTAEFGPSSQDVANADRTGPQGRNGKELRERGAERTAGAGGSHCIWPDEATWELGAPVRRISHGVSARSHRLKGLGNAIVPQVAAQIISWMTP